ncbi:hypothetical protein GCM10007859_04360 [Brevundimonas denitrificans]|uniref:Peptidase M15 n=1 Tax=Brevundimonas denitrificans TaxID=1443434 RepID=A0ABQ6BEI1_9CAUL|nr:D-Ala-D-Ala carboxypeptidase family metallohydrolase [Brevundimonas denitrificans]GLS00430.1 hypothetical protein GCM10007859_04360 [Brevundimonas denitrificans]
MTARPLDAAASRHFTYRDLCECSEAWRRTRVDNQPRSEETYRAMEALAREVLDPLVERFGRVTLTYGFASPALARVIGRGVAPQLDQHAGHERNRAGRWICPRLGQAVDLFVPATSSRDVACFIVDETPFDRLYLYGAERPIHVSHGPDHSRAVTLVDRSGLRPLPRRLTRRSLADLWPG